MTAGIKNRRMKHKIFFPALFFLSISHVFAGLDRGGNVIFEPDSDPTSMWAALAVVLGLAFFAWRESQEKDGELMRARSEIKSLKIELWELKQASKDIGNEMEKAERMASAVERYLDGLLTDDELLSLLDDIRGQGPAGGAV